MRATALLLPFLFMSPAHATVVTLTGAGSEYIGYGDYAANMGTIWYRNSGFTYNSTDSYICDDGCLFNMSDDGGTVEAQFTRDDGKLFSVLSADWRVGWGTYKSADTPPPDRNDYNAYFAWAHDSRHEERNFGWYGYRDGAIVARLEGYSGDFGRLLQFSPAFRDLDKLLVHYYTPDGAIGLDAFDAMGDGSDITEPSTSWYYDWSGEIFVDRLTLDVQDTVAPVPLPAGLPLMMTGLGLLALFARRRRA